ncbi:MAG: Ku protein [Candidatus Pacearchaeota archaeon]
MKAVWQGSISFGLVNIPIKLYTVSEPKQFSFHLLCGDCHTPLHYLRYCPKCKKEVVWQNVLHGIELEKGKWKVFTKEQIKKLKPLKAEQIEILGFTTIDRFDPILFLNNYYIVPTQEKEKAYWLFREVLHATARVAFARMIFHQKEYIVLIRPYQTGLLLTTLNYLYEIRDIKQLSELKEKEAVIKSITKEEFELAKKLVETLVKEPDFENYEDSFEKKLKELILGKIKQTKTKPKPQKLIQALKLSIKTHK